MRQRESFFQVLGCVAALWVFSHAAAAASRADYGTLPTTQMLSISPRGKLVALRRSTADTDQVWVVSLEQRKVLQRTDVASVRPRYLYFISDEEVILVASERKNLIDYGGHYEVSTAFALNALTGEVRQLLQPGDKIHMGQTGLGRIVGISSDKRHLYMPAFVSGSSGGSILGAGGVPALYLMKVDIASPRRPSVFKKGREHTLDYFTGRNDELLAMEIYNNRNNEHTVLANHDGDWISVFEDEAEIMNVSFAGVTPDQRALVMLSENTNTGRTTYAALSLEDGEVTPNLLGRQDADVERVLTDINRTAVGVQYSGLHPSYGLFDPAVDARVNEIQALFPGQSAWLRDWSEDWKHIVVYVEGTVSSGEFYLFSDGKEPTVLALARPEIEPEAVHPIIEVSIKASDGLVIPTILTVPRQYADSPKNLPAIMLPHGGPQSYDRIEFDWLAQAFANEGYLVIQPQFRGSDGFGSAHLSAGYGEWGRKMQTDLSDTLAFLAGQGVADPARVCIVGASYGGFAALAGGAFTPTLYRCVVSINGVSDLPGMLAFERKTHGSKHWIVSYFENFMVPGEATRDKLDAVSPVNFPDDFIAPVLLIHGEHDETVPFEQSDDMYDKLRKAKKDVRLVRLTDETHYLVSRKSRVTTLEEAMTFVERHIGNSSPGAPPPPDSGS
jgi:dipeptidyl aminopeptidase/acylaminoacyl peptidase